MEIADMDDGVFAEAMRWRELAREMRQIISKVSCSCDDESEREWLETLSAYTRRSLDYPEPDEVQHECPRCQALNLYDAVAGDEVVSYEMPAPSPTDEQTIRLFRKLKEMGIIDEEDN